MDNTMPKYVLAAAPITKEFILFLESKNYVLEYVQEKPIDFEKYTGIITSNKLSLLKPTLEQCTKLKWIARLGSGLEIIDTNFCQANNIFCASSPAGIANAVAEHVLATIIALQKNIVTSHNQVANGLWIREPNRGTELQNKTIGLIGLGHTGAAVANKLSVFCNNIIGFDTNGTITLPNVENVSLQELYKRVDIVSYHVPLNADTINYYKASYFTKQHILINASRGAVAYTHEILNGFKSNQLIAAGLDVLDFEHIQPFTSKENELIAQLLKYPCIITPHIAGYTFDATTKMCEELIFKFKDLL
jgi:D-3-phosphoglycerate dehydrogenase / 2-oxoglutarate reductase